MTYEHYFANFIKDAIPEVEKEFFDKFPEMKDISEINVDTIGFAFTENEAYDYLRKLISIYAHTPGAAEMFDVNLETLNQLIGEFNYRYSFLLKQTAVLNDMTDYIGEELTYNVDIQKLSFANIVHYLTYKKANYTNVARNEFTELVSDFGSVHDPWSANKPHSDYLTGKIYFIFGIPVFVKDK